MPRSPQAWPQTPALDCLLFEVTLNYTTLKSPHPGRGVSLALGMIGEAMFRIPHARKSPFLSLP